MGLKHIRLALGLLMGAALLSGCGRHLGWGVLLWPTEYPAIPAGTIVPVYIKSNINQVWVAGIPEAYRYGEFDKFEVPLAWLELAKNESQAREWSAAFAEYALLYAEVLQDGLPIRETPDNASRRVYRLKKGQIIKIIKATEGAPPVNTAGAPLSGQWYQVLTVEGTKGYCFSYRLKLFEENGGLPAQPQQGGQEEDQELDQALAKSWYAASYRDMLSSGRIDIEALRQGWSFSPGADEGLVRIRMPGLERTFSYTRIRRDGRRTWYFEGSQVSMTLQSDTELLVQYPNESGAAQRLIFVTLPAPPDNILIQELERQDALFRAIYRQGPGFASINCGVLVFTPGGRFTWTGYDLLVPHIIPAEGPGRGAIRMRLFLDPKLADRYTGAFSLLFEEAGGPDGRAFQVDFLYILDDQEIRIEYVPPEAVEELTVIRRAASPTIIYFTKNALP
ncbi:MAG: SH3 domain-containing protein [Treponema sp.]|nr:SH3 domain-containing protein [Treponema sp.]